MARINWTSCFARFASVAVIVGLASAASLVGRHDEAEACAGWEPSITDMTTFDPTVLGDDSWGGLEYDPFTEGYGGGCDECSTKAMLADWQGYLKDIVTPEDWTQVLMKASLADVFAIEQRLTGKSQKAPKGFETSSLWNATGDAQKRLYAAVEFVELLKRMEPNVTFVEFDPKVRPADPLVKELAAAQRGMKAAKDPFLQQRYAFAVMRSMFYRKEWAKAVQFFDANTKTLSASSTDLAWRARYYLAGALRKDGKAARANLELARIHAGYYPLTGLAIQDFKPAEEADWREALKLAKDRADKAALWRMIGLKHDPLVAAQEILKLDPKSTLVPLLVVRELARTESMIDASFATPDQAQKNAQKKAYARVEALALKLAVAPGTAKPWLYDLMAGHIAAKRGDVATARSRLTKAVAGAGSNVRVASQAKASLAIALVADWKLNPQNETELASLVKDIDPGFQRMSSVRNEVRSKLALAYAAANKIVDAEFLAHTVSNDFDGTDRGLAQKVNAKWQSVPFLKEMIARTDRRATEFDRFVLDGSHQKNNLLLDLAVRLTLDGDFAGAKAVFDTGTPTSDLLRTDPFVIHVIDCHDCDHEKFGEKATWTHKNLIARLAELELAAKGGGEAGAQAALAIGNALYNITHHGNARSFTDPTHQSTADARLAERYYKKVYDSSGNRELKAKAAWLAAKAELGTMIYNEEVARPNDFIDAGMMTPKTWFPIFAKFANTKYYKEVLKECDRFRDYAAARGR